MPGVYAWSSTVLFPLLQPGASLVARLCGVFAALALVSGLVLTRTQPSWGRMLALYGFVGLSLGSWVALGSLVSVNQIEPVQGLLGAFGWALFAFGWGNVRASGTVPEDDPKVIEGPVLALRQRLPLTRTLVGLIPLFGAAGCVTLAWGVQRPVHALLAQALAITCGIAQVTAGGRLASSLPAETIAAAPGSRVNAAAWSLAGLGTLLGLGFVWQLLS